MNGTVAAVDLGASSGRVILGHVGPGTLTLEPVARFGNDPVPTPDGLHWDIMTLYRQVLSGLHRGMGISPGLLSIGIDSWAVDYALMNGQLMRGAPYHYRDDRTADGVAAVHSVVDHRTLYRRNGLQFLPFNTLYQLAADQLSGALHDADRVLLIPDLLTFWLTGHEQAERTNASTTGLLDVRTRMWDDDLIEQLGFSASLLPALIDPGVTVGPLLPSVRMGLGASTALRVVTVGSHDTASAVVAVPMTEPGAAYISCGTWSLVGLELDSPVLTDASREANFTNEGGVDGRVRFLRNVMGLWLLSESMRTWQRAGADTDPDLSLTEMLAAAAEVPPHLVTTFDVDDPVFMAPGDMPARIAEHCRSHGLRPPATPAETVRSILESLAAAYAWALRAASELSGTAIDRVHVVGGGSLNTLLCQLTADRTGLPVLAGPVEATALGNVLIQARSAGLASGSLEALRALVASTHPPLTYQPRVGAVERD